MRLHTHPRTASSRRVRLFVAEKGLTIPEVRVDLEAHENWTAEFRAKNPHGTVPVLELDDGTFIAETIAICRYLELTHPEPPLLGTTPREQALVEMWQRRVELEGLLPCFDVFRNRDSTLDGQARPGWADGMARIPALVDRAPMLVRRLLGWLDDQLSHAPHVAGDRFSVADITLWVTIDIAERLAVDTGALPASVIAWRERIGARPAIAADGA